MIAAYDPIASYLDKPERPAVVPPTAYPEVQLTEFIPYSDILAKAEYVLQSDKTLSMEQLPQVNNGNGQSYGYVVYRTVVDLVRGHSHMTSARTPSPLVTVPLTQPISTIICF